MARYQPPTAAKDPSGQFAELSRVLEAPALAFRPETAAVVSVAPGEIKRLSPRAAGQTVVLQAAAASNAGQPVALFVSGLGALTVTAVTGTINGNSALTFAAGTYSLEVVSDGMQWLTPGTAAGSITGAMLGALTGEVTKPSGSAVQTVTRSTDFQASPWTGPQQFNGEIRGGTLHSSSATGAVNITLTAGSSRLLFSGSAPALGTISGAADGRLLWVEHTGTGRMVVTHDSTTADAIACPGDEDFHLIGRGGFMLVGRQGTNANWKMFAWQANAENLAPIGALGRAVPFVIRVVVTAGAAGAADDVTIYNANAPFAFRIIDVIWLDSTAIALSTVQLRDTSGGGGAALSSALTAAVTGTARNNDTATRTVAAAGSVFLRRSDRGVAGEVIIYAVRT